MKAAKAIVDFFRKTYIANVCGHKTKRKGLVSAFGGKIMMQLGLCENGKPEYCLDCIGQMSIQCAWCEGSIAIGDYVTLYAHETNTRIPKHAVRYHEDEGLLIGCMRKGCGSLFAKKLGIWTPPGVVKRIPSPVEILRVNVNNDFIIIFETSDPNDLGKLCSCKKTETPPT
jgi:hypothetical protein